MRHLPYSSALAAINCLISSCDYETQRKLIKHIYENSPDYRSEWDKMHNIPSLVQTREIVLNDIKKRTGEPTRRLVLKLKR